MKYTVVVADNIDQAGLSLLQGSDQFEVVNAAGNVELLEETLPRAHALLVRSATKVSAPMMEAAPNLRVVGRAGIGVDNVDVPAATRRGIAVINAPGANTVSAAEHTIALLLSLLRRIPEAVASMRNKDWNRGKFSGTELRGKVLGVAGFGRVGSHVAQIARAFGMSVVVYDPFLNERGGVNGVQFVSFDDLLSNSDVITLHMPMTQQTEKIIDASKFAKMKPSAVIVNTARGGLIDEDALVEAIETRQIKGAALDVFGEEPLAEDSPLRSCAGVLLTPHLGASTDEAQERVSVEICKSTSDALLNGDVRFAVNIPGVSGSAFGRLRSVLDLATRVGKLATGIADGPVESVEVQYNGPDDEAPKPTMLAAMVGVISKLGVGPVSVINSMSLAQERGINVERRVGRSVGGFETTVGVAVKTKDRTVSVTGALVGDQGRIIRIDDFKVDFVPEGNVIVLRNRDVPGVIGRVGSLLGESSINIASYHQARLDDGDDAIATIAVDHAPEADVLEKLSSLTDVIEVREIELGS